MLRAWIANESTRQCPRLDIVLEGDDARDDSVIVPNYILRPDLSSRRQLVSNVCAEKYVHRSITRNGSGDLTADVHVHQTDNASNAVLSAYTGAECAVSPCR
jgi:hypothetical protein